MNGVVETARLEIRDPQVRGLLAILDASDAVRIEPADLLEALIRHVPAINRGIEAALPANFTPSDLLARAAQRRSPQSPAGPEVSGAERYSPAALAVLAEYVESAELAGRGGVGALLGVVLSHLPDQDREIWHPLNFSRLSHLVATGKDSTVHADPALHPGQTSEYAWDDLTDRVHRAGNGQESPYDNDPQYRAFFDSLSRALHRSNPRHVLLLRERGVAERAALVEFIRQGLDGRPPYLKQMRVLMLNCRQVAMDHVRAYVEGLFASPALQSDRILVLDGFANLLRNQGYMDNKACVLAQLEKSRCRVVGILAPHEYESCIAADGEMSEVFTTVQLHEPTGPVAVELTRHFAASLQQQYRVKIDDEAIRRSVILTGNYILHERLPYKAVKVLQSVCDDIAYDRTQLGALREIVVEADIINKVSQISGVPAGTLAGIGDATDYFQSLRDCIVGQDHAVREVAAELGLIKAGFVDGGKPASVMMFIGQTGTGKTEMAKILARLYSSSKRLKTFTLGNFSEPHSVSGLIGVPAGYVGHEQGGRLINELQADPYSVFLLDEADKSHPDVMQPFLNLFDEGWIFDQRGVKAYADRAIFILTTNVGQRQIADLCKDNKPIEQITSIMKESLSKIRHSKSNRPVFTAEFLARIKRIIVFKSLDAQAMLGIARRLVADLQTAWRGHRQKELCIADSLVEAIAKRAHELDAKSQGKEGGRIVRRLLAELVEEPIQTAIGSAPGEYRGCGQVVVRYTAPAEEEGGKEFAHPKAEAVQVECLQRLKP